MEKLPTKQELLIETLGKIDEEERHCVLKHILDHVKSVYNKQEFEKAHEKRCKEEKDLIDEVTVKAEEFKMKLVNKPVQLVHESDSLENKMTCIEIVVDINLESKESHIIAVCVYFHNGKSESVNLPAESLKVVK